MPLPLQYFAGLLAALFGTLTWSTTNSAVLSAITMSAILMPIVFGAFLVLIRHRRAGQIQEIIND